MGNGLNVDPEMTRRVSLELTEQEIVDDSHVGTTTIFAGRFPSPFQLFKS